MDVFISYYRNTGGLYAWEIYDFLTQNGFDVFLDKPSFYRKTGNYREFLNENIKLSSDFILILSNNCLDDINDHPVFLQEIIMAQSSNKNIIPIFCGGFKYPQILDERISQLPKLESLDIRDEDYFKTNFIIDLIAKMTPTEKTEKVFNKLTSYTKLESRNIIEQRYPLKGCRSNNVVSIDICAMVCQGIFGNREYLDKLLNSNCKIRIIMNKPGSAAAEEACKMKISSGSLRHRMRIIPTAFDDMLDWMELYPQQFECRVTELYLPCAIFVTRKKNKSENTIKVDYYSFNCPDGERRSVYINASDYENYEFYEKQFNWIWENSEPVIHERENDL